MTTKENGGYRSGAPAAVIGVLQRFNIRLLEFVLNEH